MIETCPPNALKERTSRGWKLVRDRRWRIHSGAVLLERQNRQHRYRLKGLHRYNRRRNRVVPRVLASSLMVGRGFLCFKTGGIG